MKRVGMCAKQWKAEKQFTLDCPVCREPALPAQKADGIGGVAGYRFIHPGRIVSCFVEDSTDAAEIIRTCFNEWFGTNDTTIANQARTGQISDDSRFAEWSASYVGHIPADRAQNSWRGLYGEVPLEVEHWENEGGACTYKD
jgi:hypothetical protein